MPTQETKARFIEPMLLKRVQSLPEGPNWAYEVKLDGYRALAIKSNGKVILRSRNNRDFNAKYPDVVRALAALRDETVIDGEVVALDESGLPSFNALQNVASSKLTLAYYVFDVLILACRNVMTEPLSKRRELLCGLVLPKLTEPIRESFPLNVHLPELTKGVNAHGFEGIVAKRLDSRYEPGQRSGAWLKMRVNQGQESVIGGYTPGTRSFDALIFGYYEGDQLLYAAGTRNGFTPATRGQLYRHLQGIEIPECPFTNLPELRSGRWGVGLTSERMTQCRWLRPVLVGQFEYLEWTPDDHLRHARFIGLRDDKNPKEVRRQS
jgi:bifunctional non-homologous end joining protein LigD